MRSSLLLLTLLLPFTSLAEERIHVLVAGKNEGKCFNDLGYSIEVGDEGAKPEKKARESLKERFPDAKRFFHADNDKKGKALGRHVVIVSSTIPHAGCQKHFFGIGFGEDEAAAMKDAKRSLGKRSAWWEEARDGLEVELSEKR